MVSGGLEFDCSALFKVVRRYTVVRKRELEAAGCFKGNP